MRARARAVPCPWPCRAPGAAPNVVKRGPSEPHPHVAHILRPPPPRGRAAHLRRRPRRRHCRTGRAHQPLHRERAPAGAAPRPARRLVDLQSSTFDRRAGRHHVEAEPDGLRHDPGDLADPQVHDRDPGAVGPLDDHLDDALGDGELVHRGSSVTSGQCGPDHRVRKCLRTEPDPSRRGTTPADPPAPLARSAPRGGRRESRRRGGRSGPRLPAVGTPAGTAGRRAQRQKTAS